MVDEFFKVDVGAVDFVDDDGARKISFFRGFHHPPSDDFNARDGVDDDDDGFDGREAGNGLADQIGRAGGVDEVDALAQVIHVEDRGINRVLVLFLFFFKVGKRRAINDGTFAVDGVAGKEHGIDERRFPAAAVAGEQDIADVSGSVGGHIVWLLRFATFSEMSGRAGHGESRRQRRDKYGVWEGEGARDLKDLRIAIWSLRLVPVMKVRLNGGSESRSAKVLAGSVGNRFG